MKQLNNTKSFIIFIFFAGCLSSCKKFIEVAPPIQHIIGDAAFADSATATATVTGLYTRMMGTATLQIATGALTIYTGLYADEVYNINTANSADLFFSNSIPVRDVILRDRFWDKPYSYIYHANTCIEGLAKTPGISTSLKNRLTGECKLVRAWLYFIMYNCFGEVPLILTTDYRKNAVLPRSNEAEIWDQIIRDLTEAKELLPEVYPAAQRSRPNKWTAAAFLARVYLYKKAWQQAEQEASFVIGTGQYSLVSNLNNVFLLGSNETIWQLLSSLTAQNNSAEGFLFIPASSTARPTFPITSSLLSTFEPGDSRKTSWTKSVTVSSVVYTYPFKYKVRGSTTTPVTEGTVICRLAELYLIRSEARAQQGKLTGTASAMEDLNILRIRAGLAPLTLTGNSEILTAIQKERRIELFCESGHRWFDLKRLELADAELGTKPGWNATDIRFPIPQLEISKNMALTQNAGY